MAVTVIEHPLILWPMNASKDAVQELQVIVVVLDPFSRFSHSEVRVASRHAFDAHQANGFSIEVKTSANDFQFANAKRCFELVAVFRAVDFDLQTVQMG